MSIPKTRSRASTRGVKVEVSSEYLPSQSRPVSRRHVFAYTITISNEGDQTVQLRSRHWVITSADGKVEQVRGPGVVGEQPILRPGESFRYSSGAVLETERGSMHGSYRMVMPDGSEFDAEIAEFALERPYSLN